MNLKAFMLQSAFYQRGSFDTRFSLSNGEFLRGWAFIRSFTILLTSINIMMVVKLKSKFVSCTHGQTFSTTSVCKYLKGVE